jgi:hypothetical protein
LIDVVSGDVRSGGEMDIEQDEGVGTIFFFWNSSDYLIVMVYCYGLKIYCCIYRSI